MGSINSKIDCSCLGNQKPTKFGQIPNTEEPDSDEYTESGSETTDTDNDSDNDNDNNITINNNNNNFMEDDHDMDDFEQSISPLQISRNGSNTSAMSSLSRVSLSNKNRNPNPAKPTNNVFDTNNNLQFMSKSPKNVTIDLFPHHSAPAPSTSYLKQPRYSLPLLIPSKPQKPIQIPTNLNIQQLAISPTSVPSPSITPTSPLSTRSFPLHMDRLQSAPLPSLQQNNITIPQYQPLNVTSNSVPNLYPNRYSSYNSYNPRTNPSSSPTPTSGLITIQSNEEVQFQQFRPHETTNRRHKRRRVSTQSLPCLSSSKNNVNKQNATNWSRKELINKHKEMKKQLQYLMNEEQTIKSRKSKHKKSHSVNWIE